MNWKTKNGHEQHFFKKELNPLTELILYLQRFYKRGNSKVKLPV